MSEMKKVPVACIVESRMYTYCGRSADAKEFTFQDAEHAITFYEHSTHIKACPNCVEAWKKLGHDLTHYSRK